MSNTSQNKTYKPMRLENELIELIEAKGEGNNFTAKTESCLKDYFNSEIDRVNRISALENEIRNKEKSKEDLESHIKLLNELVESIGSILSTSFKLDNSLSYKLNRVKNNVDELENNLNILNNTRY